MHFFQYILNFTADVQSNIKIFLKEKMELTKNLLEKEKSDYSMKSADIISTSFE